VKNYYPNREIDQNDSVLVAAYRSLRRQPWKRMATSTWNTMKRFLDAIMVALLLAVVLVPTAAQARTYDVINVDVPFKFSIGNRTFRPGHYQFIFVGVGLLALRDAKAHTVASLITRSVETGAPSPESKLVFKKDGKHGKRSQLDRICIERRSQVLEVLGEEPVIPHAPAPPAPLPPGVDSLLDVRSGHGLRQ
jgi:hypothetical protein